MTAIHSSEYSLINIADAHKADFAGDSSDFESAGVYEAFNWYLPAGFEFEGLGS